MSERGKEGKLDPGGPHHCSKTSGNVNHQVSPGADGRKKHTGWEISGTASRNDHTVHMFDKHKLQSSIGRKKGGRFHGLGEVAEKGSLKDSCLRT